MSDIDLKVILGSILILSSTFFDYSSIDEILCLVGLICMLEAVIEYRRKIKSSKIITNVRIDHQVWSCTRDFDTNELVWTNTTTQHKFPAEDYDEYTSGEELKDNLTPKTFYPFKKH